MPRGRKKKSPIFKAIAEIQNYLAQLDAEISAKVAERDELKRALGATGTAAPMKAIKIKPTKAPKAKTSKRAPRGSNVPTEGDLKAILGVLGKEGKKRKAIVTDSGIRTIKVQRGLLMLETKKAAKRKGEKAATEWFKA